jgi:hypothetical protein
MRDDQRTFVEFATGYCHRRTGVTILTPSRPGARSAKGCDVRLQCLEWALSTGQDAGVWGGTSEEERRSIRRARRRQTASTRHVAAVG